MFACCRRWRSIIPTLDQWWPVAGNAMALLAIHAYYQLLVAYSGIGEVVDLPALLQLERASLIKVLLCKARLGLCEFSSSSSSTGHGSTHQGQGACHTAARAALVLTAPATLPVLAGSVQVARRTSPAACRRGQWLQAASALLLHRSAWKSWEWAHLLGGFIGACCCRCGLGHAWRCQRRHKAAVFASSQDAELRSPPSNGLLCTVCVLK